MIKQLRTLLWACILCLLTAPVWAQQDTRISANFHNQPLSEALDHLRTEYQLIFAYDVDLVAHIRVKQKIKSLSIREAMTKLLENTPLEFRIVKDRQIIISRRPRLAGMNLPAAKPVSVSRFQITGRVQDSETGLPLAYAGIRIADTHSGISSRADGSFLLQAPTRELLTLEVSYVGYNQVRIPVVPGKLKGPLMINLSPLVLLLDEVIIEEGQAPIVEAGDRVSSLRVNTRNIGKISGLGKPDIIQTLRLLPGISSSHDVSPGLYIRGGTPDQNLVLYDGITAYRSDHFFGLFSSFNPDATSHVDLYKGGFGANFGGRVSGVVDVHGKSPDLNTIHLRGNVNLLDAHIATEIPLVTDKVSLLLAARRSVNGFMNSELYQQMLTAMLGDETRNRNDNFATGLDLVQFRLAPELTFSDVNLRLAIKPSPRDSISLSYFQAQDQLSYSIGTDSAKVTSGANTKVITHTDELALSNSGLGMAWYRKIGADFQTKLGMSRSRFVNDYEYAFTTETDRSSHSSYLDQYNGIRELKAGWDNNWKIGSQHHLSFGAEVSRQDIRYRLGSGSILWGKDHDPGTIYAGYTQSEIRPISGMKIRGGLRFSYFDITQKTYWEPRLAMDVKVLPNTRLTLAAGKYCQFINRVVVNNELGLGEDFWAMANGAAIPVQTATDVITGLAYETPEFLLSIEGYSKQVNGILEYVHGIYLTELDETVEGELTTGGVSRSSGIELLLQKKRGYYTGWISYTIGRVSNRFDDVNSGNYFPALQDQRHELKIVNSLSLKQWDITASWIYASGKPYTAAVGTYYSELADGSAVHFIQVGKRNAQRLPDYHRLDLTASYKWKIGNVRGTAGAAVYNIYNRENIRTRRYSLHTPVSRTVSSQLSVSNVSHLGFTPNLFVSFDL